MCANPEFLPDARPRINVDPRADNGVAEARMRADTAVGTDRNAPADRHMRAEPATRADLGASSITQ